MSIQVRQFFTATNPNLLLGTGLQTIPFNGVLGIFASAGDGTAGITDGQITITAPRSRSPFSAQPPVPRADFSIRGDEDPPLAIFPVRQGDQIVIAYIEVTAATLQFLAILSRRRRR